MATGYRKESDTLLDLERQKEAVRIYRGLFMNLRDGLVILHVETAEPKSVAKVVDVNPAASEVFSAGPPESGEGTEPFSVFGEAKFQQACRETVVAGTSIDFGEIRGPGGRLFRLRLVPLLDGYLGVIMSDISDRERDETEIARLLARVGQDAVELEQRVADRTVQLEEINAELDAFAYSISHDLRAPLRAIQGFAQVLLEDRHYGRDPQRESYLERIVAAALGMDQQIQDLLVYSRVSHKEIMLKTVNLEQVVREAAGQLQLQVGTKYQLDLAGSLPRARGNHPLLVQVLLNLMSNAVKFVARGVTPELRIWGEQAGDTVRLFVQDNGIGIAPEHQEQIFKLFARLHGVEMYPGTGIGLAIARKAVTRLGGRIGVESRLGEGSRFWIELPAG